MTSTSIASVSAQIGSLLHASIRLSSLRRRIATSALALSLTLILHAAEFVHPGILHSQDDLDRLKSAVSNQTGVIYQGYQAFAAQSRSKSTYTMQGPFAVFGRQAGQNTGAMHSDSCAAYQNAVMWAVTGNQAHADKAIQILNRWSSVMTAVIGTEQALSSMDGYMLVNAAEILRYTPSGWSSSDIVRCETWFKTVWYPAFANFAYHANGNWDAAAIKSMMATGVFCNDRVLFERGVRFYLDGAGNGRLTHYVINEAGQVQESGRDQGHTQLGLGLLSEAAQIGWNQGLDLFSVAGNRLLKGFEYTANYNLGNAVPFTPTIDRTGKYGLGGTFANYSVVSTIDRGKYRPVFELVWNHYRFRAGLPASAITFSKQFADANRPEGAAVGPDHPGFGTFLFSLAGPLPPVAPTVPPLKPAGLYAYGASTGNTISWAPSRDVVAYIIKRSATPAGPYLTVASGLTSPTYFDAAVGPGQLYYYVVSAINNIGESANSLAVSISAGLPTPWGNADLGGATPTGRADFDGDVFKLEAAGSDIGGTSDQFHFASAPMVGDGTVIARVTLPLSSQSAKVGLMIRETLTAGSRHASLFLPVSSKAVWITRSAPGAATVNGAAATIPAPYEADGHFDSSYWVKLTRKGDVFSGSISPDGAAWTPLDSSTVMMAGKVYVGLAACSRIPGRTTTAAFDHVSVPGLPVTSTSVPAITSSASATSAVGDVFTYTITATHSPTRFGATSLPAGLVLDAATGVISGRLLTSGSFPFTISAANAAGSASTLLTVTATPAPIRVTLTSASQAAGTCGRPFQYQITATGSPDSFVATDLPPGLTLDSRSGLISGTPSLPGNYLVTLSASNSMGRATLSMEFTIAKAPATITLGGLNRVYNGAPQSALATTNPVSLPVTFTYDGSSAMPVNAGSYVVVATLSDPRYTGSTSGKLVIAKADATLTLGQLTQTFDGEPKTPSATTQPAGLAVDLTYNGSLSLPLHAGRYAVAAAVNNPNYQATAAATLTIGKKVANLELSGLQQPYNGSAKKVTATTTPGKLTVHITYGGKATAPVYPGSYAVAATIEDPDYTASVADTLTLTTTAVVSHAPDLNGTIEGSIQMLLPESLTLNAAAGISGDLLVPGTPSVQLLGSPNYVSTQDGPGAASPTQYQIVLKSGSILRHTVRHIDALARPVVSKPSLPTGTRNVWIDPTAKNPGSYKSVRNLTLNGDVGIFSVPAGNYGDFTAHSRGGFSLGVPGATQPEIYSFQNLILTGTSELRIVGPVIVTLANGAIFTGTLGNSAHPEWLTLRVASGGITCNNNCTLNGSVITPHGTLSVNDNSTVAGHVISDRLSINGSGSLVDPAN